MNFLETDNAYGNNVLVPIDRIKHISIRYFQRWEIHIVSDDDTWTEAFINEKEMAERWSYLQCLLIKRARSNEYDDYFIRNQKKEGEPIKTESHND